MTAAELKTQVVQLQVERRVALEAGLGENAMYMGDLDEELEYRTQLYVTVAVTEIATLRAELGEPQVG